MFLHVLNTLIIITLRSASEISASVNLCGFVSIVCLSLDFHLGLVPSAAIRHRKPGASGAFSRASRVWWVMSFNFIFLTLRRYQKLCLAPQHLNHCLPGFSASRLRLINWQMPPEGKQPKLGPLLYASLLSGGVWEDHFIQFEVCIMA